MHYNDDIMIAMASQITSLTIVYSTFYSGADQRKHQSSASLAFVRVTGEFPAQKPSHAGNVAVWWRHHGQFWCTAAKVGVHWTYKNSTNILYKTVQIYDRCSSHQVTGELGRYPVAQKLILRSYNYWKQLIYSPKNLLLKTPTFYIGWSRYGNSSALGYYSLSHRYCSL